MEAFTERYGHILYKQSLSRKYITPDSVCEIKGCAEYQRAINEQMVKEGYEPNGKIKLGLDHCHKHGYIRGIICNSCNTAIGHIETTHLPPWHADFPKPGYNGYLKNACPDCVAGKSEICTYCEGTERHYVDQHCEECGEHECACDDIDDVDPAYKFSQMARES
jgi:hypothetical protein